MIRKVEEIPMSPQEKNRSQRELIRRDIEEAMKQHIDKFEFIGEGYNYKYLSGYAREEAERIFRKTTLPVAIELKKELKTETGEKYIFLPSPWEYKGRAFKISSIKDGDSRRVFCTIDYDFIAKFKDTLRADYLKHQQVIEARRKEREEAEEP